jgi:hypothetical protein
VAPTVREVAAEAVTPGGLTGAAAKELEEALRQRLIETGGIPTLKAKPNSTQTMSLWSSGYYADKGIGSGPLDMDPESARMLLQLFDHYAGEEVAPLWLRGINGEMGAFGAGDLRPELEAIAAKAPTARAAAAEAVTPPPVTRNDQVLDWLVQAGRRSGPRNQAGRGPNYGYRRDGKPVRNWSQVTQDLGMDAEAFLTKIGRLGASEDEVLAFVRGKYLEGAIGSGRPLSWADSKPWDAAAQGKYAKGLKQYLDNLHKDLGGIEDVGPEVAPTPRAVAAEALTPPPAAVALNEPPRSFAMPQSMRDAFDILAQDHPNITVTSKGVRYDPETLDDLDELLSELELNDANYYMEGLHNEYDTGTRRTPPTYRDDKNAKGVVYGENSDEARIEKALKAFRDHWESVVAKHRKSTQEIVEEVLAKEAATRLPPGAGVAARRAAARRKVFSACTGDKCPMVEGATVAAEDLYTGDSFVYLKRQIEGSDAELGGIISAKHGVLDPTEMVGSYNKKLPKTGAQDIVAGPEQLRKFVALVGDAEELFFYGPGAYRTLMKNLLWRAKRDGLVGRHVRVVEPTGTGKAGGARGSGEIKKSFGEWVMRCWGVCGRLRWRLRRRLRHLRPWWTGCLPGWTVNWMSWRRSVLRARRLRRLRQRGLRRMWAHASIPMRLILMVLCEGRWGYPLIGRCMGRRWLNCKTWLMRMLL